jgi:hypothetical protein
MILGLIVGTTLLSFGLYQHIMEIKNKKFNNWFINDKVKMVGITKLKTLLGWSSDSFYIDEDGITTKHNWKEFESNQSAQWRKNYDDCKKIMKKEPGFSSELGKKIIVNKIIFGRSVDTLSEIECQIYLTKCIDNEDFESAELIKKRLEELK